MDQFHMIDVGGYRLSFQQYGTGSPTVVFEHGLDSGSASLVSLAKEIQHVTGALVYDRAGLGQSEAGPRPRTSRDMANDLHILLKKMQIAGPSILVGQSIGGLNVRVYAHQYPEDVAGIIFLDASHPAQWTRYLDLLPPASPSENPAMRAFRLSTLEELNEPMKNQEGMDVATSAQQVAAIGGLGRLPVVVITAGLDEWEPGFPEEVAEREGLGWMHLQKELAMLSTEGIHIVAEKSYHVIQEYQPDLVIEAIVQMVERIRSQEDSCPPHLLTE